MTHFTYAERLPTDDLHQGDILQRTDHLVAVLQDVHPHFADEQRYPMFMVLTQSCDLVRRTGGSCNSHYINICVVRDFLLAIKREVGMLGHPDLGRHGLLPVKLKAKASQVIERFLNNTEPGYFYLHPDFAIPKPMCAFLTLSISLRAEDHYNECLDARILGLKPEFRAKVGWLIGAIYSRVATEDWQSQTDFDKKDFDSRIEEVVNHNFLWLDELGERKVKKAVKESELNLENPDEIVEFVSKLPSQHDEVAAAIKEEIMRMNDRKINEVLAVALTKRILERKGVESRYIERSDEELL